VPFADVQARTCSAEVVAEVGNVELLIDRILALPAPLIPRVAHHLIDHLDRVDDDPDVDDCGDVEAIDECEADSGTWLEAPIRCSKIRLVGR
jgi:hypothetical protein